MAFIIVVAIIVAVPLYGVPATLSLPKGVRPGIEPLTIAQAAQRLQLTGKSGMELVEAARSLVAGRMAYCRRNSFDIYTKAFQRGYGYCQQHAYSLVDLLNRLGFEASVVHAFRNRIDGESVGGHAWVQVIIDGKAHNVDSLHYDDKARMLAFEPLSRVQRYNPVFRVLAGWGCIAVNAHRYYVTGKDEG